MKNYSHLLTTALDMPLFISNTKAEVLMNTILPHLIRGESLEKLDKDTSKEERALELYESCGVISFGKGNALTDTELTFSEKDIVGINIIGSLTNRTSFFSSGGASYDSLRGAIQSVVAAGAKNIMFLNDSGGGEAAGLFTLTPYIRSLQEQGVFTFTYIDSGSFSAAYALAAATDYITATESSQQGSIGALLIHKEISGALADQGIKFTIVRSKPLKAQGDPYSPITDKYLAKMEHLVDSFDTMFNNDVMASRPNLTLDSLIAMQGDTFLANDSLSKGLIDKVVIDANDAILSAMEYRDTVWRKNSGQSTRTVVKTTTNLNSTKAKSMNEEELKLALEAQKTETVKATAAGIAAVEAERTRCSSIIAASAKLGLSSDLALKHIEKGYSTDMSLDTMTEIAAANDVKKTIQTSLETQLDPDLELQANEDGSAKIRMNALREGASYAGYKFKGVN